MALPTINDLPDLYEIDLDKVLNDLRNPKATDEKPALVEAPVVDDVAEGGNDLDAESVVADMIEGKEGVEDVLEEESKEEIEEVEEKDEDKNEDKNEDKEKKSAIRRLLEKKERAVREKEIDLRKREADILAQKEAIEKDPVVAQAKQIAELVKAKKLGKAMEYFGIKEADFLEYYGITKEKAGEVALSAELKAEKLAIEQQKAEAEAKIRQAEEIKQYQIAKRQLTDTVTAEISQYKTLKALDIAEVLEEIEAGVVKVANSGSANHLTLVEITREVLKYSDKVWSERAEKISKARAQGKPQASNSGDVSNKSKPTAKTEVKKVEEVAKPKPTQTLSNKGKVATPAKPAPKKLEWSPENSDEFDDLVFKQFLSGK